jgi:hypothetical protein
MVQWIRHRPADPGLRVPEVIGFAWRDARAERETKAKRVTNVGFEPTPLRAGALSQRLRPHAQTAVAADASRKKGRENTSPGEEETPKRRQRE